MYFLPAQIILNIILGCFFPVNLIKSKNSNHIFGYGYLASDPIINHDTSQAIVLINWKVREISCKPVKHVEWQLMFFNDCCSDRPHIHGGIMLKYATGANVLLCDVSDHVVTVLQSDPGASRQNFWLIQLPAERSTHTTYKKAFQTGRKPSRQDVARALMKPIFSVSPMTKAVK